MTSVYDGLRVQNARPSKDGAMAKKEIPVEEIELGMYIADLDRPWLGTPFAYQGFFVTSESHIDALKKHCRSVFVDTDMRWEREGEAASGSEAPLVKGTVVYRVQSPVEAEVVVAKEMYSACEQTVRTSFESLRETGELDPKPLTAAVGGMTRSIERNPDAMMLLAVIRQKRSEAFNRAVDTSIHMMIFGRFLQFDSARIETLGLAGLLLDVGMLKIPDTVLQKRSTLTNEEYELTKSHVKLSVEAIRAAPGLPQGVEDIVMQHHERQDGSGYPRGLRNREISIDGAIAGLVDSYTALTSRRTYAQQESPSASLMALYKSRGKLYHEALVEQFIQCLGIYPVGSMVELNSGEIAVIIAQNLVRRLQPRVMIVLDGAMNPVYPQLILDLTREPKTPSGEPYRILRTIPKNKLPLDLKQFFLEMTG